MTREELERSWALTRQFLNHAIELVPLSDSKMLDQYTDYLDHNELELAMEELVYLGEEKKYPAEFFEPLKSAVLNMGLAERASDIEESSIVPRK